MARVKFTTNIDERLLKELKSIALNYNVGANDIIEEFIKELLSARPTEFKMVLLNKLRTISEGK